MQSTEHSHANMSRGILFVLMAAVLWGTGGVVKQTITGLAETNALSIAFFRMVFSVPILMLACALTLRRNMFRITRRDLLITLLIGGLIGIYQALYFASISEVGVSIATLVALCGALVVVAIESTVLMKERLTNRVWLAMACALSGIVLLTGFQTGAPGKVMLGVLMAMGSATAYATVTVISRTLSRETHPLQTSAFGFAFGALILFVLASASSNMVIRYPPLGWALLVYLGVMTTALAYTFFLTGMRSTPATVASILTLLEPLVAAVLAWVIFGERFSGLGFVGAGLLVAAMLVLVLRRT